MKSEGFDFDRAKPFYPIVISYVTQIIGFQEAYLMGIENLSRKFFLNGVELVDDGQRTGKHGKLKHAIFDPIILEITDNRLILPIDVQDVVRELHPRINVLGLYQMKAAAMHLRLAYEITKGLRDNSNPLWEFLRHCSNAAAHDCKFRLLGKEPKAPAEWRGIKLLKSHHGRPLFKVPKDSNGILQTGDPIVLLYDLEQTIPYH